MLQQSELAAYEGIFKADPNIKLIELLTYRTTTNNTPYDPALFHMVLDKSTNQQVIKCKRDVEYLSGQCLPFMSYIDRDLNVHHITTTRYMFLGCCKLTDITSGVWNLTEVTDMESMFRDCIALTNVATHDWLLDTYRKGRVINSINKMFYRCLALRILDLRSFEHADIVNASEAFKFCLNLQHVEIGYISIYRVNASVASMFEETINLKYVSGIANWYIKYNSSIDITNAFYHSGLRMPNWLDNILRHRKAIAERQAQAKAQLQEPEQPAVSLSPRRMMASDDELPAIVHMQVREMPTIEQVQERFQKLVELV